MRSSALRWVRARERWELALASVGSAVPRAFLLSPLPFLPPLLFRSHGDTGDSGEQGIATIGDLQCRLPNAAEQAEAAAIAAAYEAAVEAGNAIGCDLLETDDRGRQWCVIGHDQSAPTMVQGTEAQNGVSINVNWNRPLSSVTASLQSCSVHYRYDCKGSVTW